MFKLSLIFCTLSFDQIRENLLDALLKRFTIYKLIKSLYRLRNLL